MYTPYLHIFASYVRHFCWFRHTKSLPRPPFCHFPIVHAQFFEARASDATQNWTWQELDLVGDSTVKHHGYSTIIYMG